MNTRNPAAVPLERYINQHGLTLFEVGKAARISDGTLRAFVGENSYRPLTARTERRVFGALLRLTDIDIHGITKLEKEMAEVCSNFEGSKNRRHRTDIPALARHIIEADSIETIKAAGKLPPEKPSFQSDPGPEAVDFVGPQQIPLMGLVSAGNEPAHIPEDPIEYLTFRGIPKSAYVIIVGTRDAAPKYDIGDTLLVDPAHPPKPGDTVILYLKTDQENLLGDKAAKIRYLASYDTGADGEDLIIVEKFREKPQRKEETFLMRDVEKIHRVLSIADLF